MSRIDNRGGKRYIVPVQPKGGAAMSDPDTGRRMQTVHREKHAQDMTQGSILRHLIVYAVPMILGNLLQLTYNAVDSVIIGKLLGEDALAAVSTSGPIMTILVLGASGLSLGASVLISRFYGAKDPERVKREFSTTLLFGLFFSLAVFLAGYALSGPVLVWIRTPDSAMAEARVYLRIVLVGFLFTFQYNILSASLRGIGDSRTPVYFLGLSCVGNMVLDVLLVAVIPLGVAGAALATTLSQAVCTGLCVLYIRKRIPELHLDRQDLRVDPDLLKQTLRLGSITVLQQSAQPVGKLFIQKAINAQGVIAIGAFNAASKLDDYARIPTQSIGSAIMTGTAQNRGAGRQDRERDCFRKGVLLALAYYPLIFLLVRLVRRPAAALLCPDGSTEMVAMAAEYLAVKAWFFVMPCLTNTVQGHFSGISQMRIVLAGTLLQITVRTVMVLLWVPKMGIVGEAYACFAGWICQVLLQYGIYFLHRFREARSRQT